MRILRAIVFGLGMGFTALVVFLYRLDAAPHLAVVSPSPGRLLPALTIVSPLQDPLRLTERFHWGLFAAWLAIVLLSLILAHRLERSKWSWTLSVGVFPFLSPQLLACLYPLSRKPGSFLVLRFFAVLCGSCTILAAAYAIDRGSLSNAANTLSREQAAQAVWTENEAPGAKPALSRVEQIEKFLDRQELWYRRNVLPAWSSIWQDRDVVRLWSAWLSTILATCLLARALRRGVFDWTMFALFAPFIAPIILATRDRAEERQSSWVAVSVLSFLSGLTLFIAVVAACVDPSAASSAISSPPGIPILAGVWPLAILSATSTATLKGQGLLRSAALALVLPWLFPMVVALQERPAFLDRSPISGFRRFIWLRYLGLVSFGKRCGNSQCAKAVPIWSHAGQSCPHCGVYWRSEVQVSGTFRK